MKSYYFLIFVYVASSLILAVVLSFLCRHGHGTVLVYENFNYLLLHLVSSFSFSFHSST